MTRFPERLSRKLLKRESENAFRKLASRTGLADFCSNDYLGFSQNKTIAEKAKFTIANNKQFQNGATGSRLLSGNHTLYENLEKTVAEFHGVEAALVFNSGYDANLGFFSSVPQRGDYIFYDEFAHASIRDGILMSHAKAYKFRHNDLQDLHLGIERTLSAGRQGRNAENQNTEIYIVTESVFSMDGDSPNLTTLAEFCSSSRYHLIVDEAHATGIFGEGKGLVNMLGLENQIFARLVTFGKALGCHGSAWLGGEKLKSYLVNFARSFIYTTALPSHTVASVLAAYAFLQQYGPAEQKRLFDNIQYFKSEVQRLQLKPVFIESNAAIQSAIISGNTNARRLSDTLAKTGFDVRPILSPTVPVGSERLRICLHSFNEKNDIAGLLQTIAMAVNG